MLDALKYDKYSWEVTEDCKVVAFLMKLQGGFTKVQSCLCLCGQLGHQGALPKAGLVTTDQAETTSSINIKWESLVEPWKVLVSPLHIKLGLIKQIVTALNKELAVFKNL